MTTNAIKDALLALRDPHSGCWCSGADGHSQRCLQAMDALDPGAAERAHKVWLAEEMAYRERSERAHKVWLAEEMVRGITDNLIAKDDPNAPDRRPSWPKATESTE